jgi:hypothetical protein
MYCRNSTLILHANWLILVVNLLGFSSFVLAQGEVQVQEQGVCDYSNADISNGWGWNAVTRQSCEPLTDIPTAVDNCDYSNAAQFDGWGWDPVAGQSCAPQDNCDYSNAAISGGWGWNPVAAESCPPLNTPLTTPLTTGSVPAGACDYSNAAAYDGWGWNAVTRESCPPLDNTVDEPVFVDQPVVTRESINNLGWAESGGGGNARVSANGRYVAFSSISRSLVPFDNDRADVYVRDQVMGITRKVSVSSSGGLANRSSYGHSISADGRYVAFSSEATNLVAGDNPANTEHVYVHDMLQGFTTRISFSAGDDSGSNSYNTDISYDGRYVVFQSAASDLIDPDNDVWSWTQVYLYDRQTGTTRQVSQSSEGIAGNRASFSAKISGDGRWVAFQSEANNLVADDLPANPGRGDDIFLRDMQTGEIKRISVNADGVAANRVSEMQDISADGRFVLFTSEATNLTSDGTILAEFGARDNLYIYDHESGITQAVGIPAVVVPGTEPYSVRVGAASISDDGQYISFTSADRLASLNQPAPADFSIYNRYLYLHNRITGVTKQIAGLGSGAVSLSADGRYLAFSHGASNLTANDSNNRGDVFIADFAPNASGALSVDPFCPAGSQTCLPFGVENTWDGDISGPVVLDPEVMTEAFYGDADCYDADGDGYGWQHPEGTPGRSCIVR